MRLRSDKHNGNINKRGNVSTGSRKESKYTVGPILLGFFLFVVVGSCKSSLSIAHCDIVHFNRCALTFPRDTCVYPALQPSFR